MNKSLILFFLFLISKSTFGQRYKTTDIIKKADSLIISVVGQNIFNNNYQLDSTKEIDSWQKTYDKERKIKRLSLNSKTTKHFTFIAIDYIFFINKHQQPFFQTKIIFDRNFNPQEPVDTSFIPKYILRGTENDMLLESDVLKIAKAKFVRQGIKPIVASLNYDHDKKFYVWTVHNIINEWKDSYNNSWKTVEMLEVKAIGGQLLNYEANALFGPVY